MRKIVNLSIDQMVDRIMELDVGDKFDFAGGTTEKERDLEKMTEKDLTYWYGAKVMREFDQSVLLLGYYGGGPLSAISLEDEEDEIRSNIRQALLRLDVAEWKRAGCYVVENIKEQYRVFEETLVLNKVDTDYLNRLLHEIPQSPDECLMGEDDSESYGIKFENGYSVDIRVCGVKFEEGSTNLPWTEAILCDETGCEVCVSDACDEFFGTWRLVDPDNNNIYVLRVEESPNKERIVKIGDLEIMCKNEGVQFINVKDNSARGFSAVSVNQVKVGDYVVLADDHLTRVVPDNVLYNTYPDYRTSDYDEIAKKIAEINRNLADKSATRQEKATVMVDGEIKELPVILDSQGKNETLTFLRDIVDAVEIWEGIVPMESTEKLPPLEVRDEIKFNKDTDQIEMTQAAFEWFEQYTVKHNGVSELESQLLAHIRSKDEMQSYWCADAEAENLDQAAELKKQWLRNFAKTHSIRLNKGNEKGKNYGTDFVR